MNGLLHYLGRPSTFIPILIYSTILLLVVVTPYELLSIFLAVFFGWRTGRWVRAISAELRAKEDANETKSEG